MKRPLINRADLLRALQHNDSALTTAMSELLGYERVKRRQELQGQADVDLQQSVSQRDSQSTAEITTTYQPEPVPFWRLETFEAVARVKLPVEHADSTPSEVAWPERLTTVPDFVPLAQKREILTELRKSSATRRTTREIDVEAVVERVSQGQLLEQLPHRQHRAWGSRITIIEDRARRLTPYWNDQDHVVDILHSLYPSSGMSIARIEGGESYPTIRWPQEQRGQIVTPLPGVIVLVLGDLGCLARQGEKVQRLWMQWGHHLREQNIPAVALVPAKLSDVPSDLACVWTIVRWGVAAPVSDERVSELQMSPVEQLLTLLSPAVRIEPGLLRAVRCLLPEGRHDPGLEARVWQDAAIASQHSVAASWDARARETYGAHFAKQPEALRSEVLELIQSWRVNLSPMVKIEEFAWLDRDSRRLVDPREWKSLVTALAEYVHALRQKRELSASTVAWIARFLERSPSEVFHDLQIEQIRHDLYALVRSHAAVTEVYGWLDPGKLPPGPQEERRVALCQVADQLLVKTVDTTSADPIMRGSPLGMVHTANGEVKVTVGELPPDKNDFWQSKRRPAWAQDWGWDAFGAWVTLRVGGVEQHMRWIPSGSFVMGSPEDEEGRYGNEGPQHEVQLTRGFWLFDTPCTQALWQAVMGDNPSRFKGTDRPVEQVSWQDCQEFISRLNQQLPDLNLRLPTEAQWEYACRAGTTTVRYEEKLDAIAWYRENSNGETHPVKQKRPNGWGLYDMLGNVDEWCLDGLREYAKKRRVDPLGPTSVGTNRAMRGGYWGWGAQSVRTAIRDGDPSGHRGGYLGFRCSSSTEHQPVQVWSPGRAAQRQAEPAQTAPRRPDAQLLDVNQQAQISIGMPQERVFQISTDRDHVRFAQITLPECSWASEMGRDAYGLWAEFEVKKVRQRMRWIPPGRFGMGSLEEDREAFAREKPQYEVQLTHGFWLFDTPCTQALWQAVMRKNPSGFKGKERPVEHVSWEDCQKFIAKLNEMLPDLALGLPTEAEWEYACRAGTATPRYAEDLDAIAWYDKNSNNETHQVKQKRPNAWGLYDMLGNVDEWCYDGPRKYEAEAMIDPLGPTDAGADRAVRGGFWYWDARNVRAASRLGLHPGGRDGDLGFRCASSGQASRGDKGAVSHQLSAVSSSKK